MLTNQPITLKQWELMGTALFGPDRMRWKFVCPACGHVATPQDWKDAGAPVSAVAYSCVGRWKGEKRRAFGGEGPGPCDFAGGGLFKVGPMIVDGTAYFAFADDVPGVKGAR